MKLIPLTQGLYAQVDDEDFDYLNQFSWHAMKDGHNFYVRRGVRINGKVKIYRMHNEIMNAKGIDHIDGNGLNNQRNNLRHATRQQNGANRIKRRKSKSVYKGVCFVKKNNKWRAQLRFNKKLLSLGTFDTDIEAAEAYDAKAKELFGEFAKLNFEK